MPSLRTLPIKRVCTNKTEIRFTRKTLPPREGYINENANVHRTHARCRQKPFYNHKAYTVKYIYIFHQAPYPSYKLISRQQSKKGWLVNVSLGCIFAFEKYVLEPTHIRFSSLRQG